MATYKGRFKPKNPGKYKGDPTNIIYRSGWEFKFMAFLDTHPGVLEWQSEEIAIPYRNPVTRRIHRYFPDFLVKTNKATTLIEVKPSRETKPSQSKPNTRRFIKESMTYARNVAKWEAADAYARDRGWTFRVMTEADLGIRANG